MTTARTALNRLADFMVEDIMSMSDEEILAECIEDGIDIEQNAARGRALFEKVAAEVRSVNSTVQCANPACPCVLTKAQVVEGGRYCSRSCAHTQPRKGKAETYAQTAARLGISRQALYEAIRAGRYVDGVYTPGTIGRPKCKTAN